MVRKIEAGCLAIIVKADHFPNIGKEVLVGLLSTMHDNRVWNVTTEAVTSSGEPALFCSEDRLMRIDDPDLQKELTKQKRQVAV